VTSLFMITRDPFERWKRVTAVLPRAKRIGMEVVIALDDRTDIKDARRIGAMADQVITWKSAGHCEDAYDLVQHCSQDFVFLVSDDEEPSDLCWRLAAEPPFAGVFGVPVIPILGKKWWKADIGFQDRIFPRKDWRWEGGYNGRMVHPYRTYHIGVNPGVVIWHHLLAAPRAERERKAAVYESLGPGDHRGRIIYEEHPEALVEMPDYMLAYLPKRLN